MTIERLATIDVVAGPDAGRVVELTAGTYLLGRASTCDVPIADSDLEAHHVLVEFAADDTIRVAQLAGRQPLLVDGEPHPEGGVRDGAAITIGATRITVRSCGNDNRWRTSIRGVGGDTVWSTLASV
ncbi:MAG TPA: FHA domain-containing protein, partial [Ilumatobacter sp.]|nr:FHA domain-containing protein [Ilumatobacter sp.]